MIKNLLLLTIFCSLTLCGPWGPWPFTVIREASYGVVKGLTYTVLVSEVYMLEVVCKNSWKKINFNITSNIKGCDDVQREVLYDCDSGESFQLTIFANQYCYKNTQINVAIGREDFKDDYLEIRFQSAFQLPGQKHADNLQIQ